MVNAWNVWCRWRLFTSVSTQYSFARAASTCQQCTWKGKQNQADMLLLSENVSFELDVYSCACFETSKCGKLFNYLIWLFFRVFWYSNAEVNHLCLEDSVMLAVCNENDVRAQRVYIPCCSRCFLRYTGCSVALPKSCFIK